MGRAQLHLVLHFVVPLLVALVVWRRQWWKAWAVMMATMAVDLDHLLADPLYDPNRCSLNTHPLHTPIPIAIYVALAVYPRTRWVGVGLVIHMILDSHDCWRMGHGWLNLG